MKNQFQKSGSRNIPTFNSYNERASFLRSRGYEYVRQGKGGHEHWRHTAVYESAVARGVKLPQNLAGISTVAKTPGEIILSTPDCTPYTWEGIVKQINWSAEEFVANDPVAMSAEREERRAMMDALRQNLRAVKEDRRALTLQQRALCQAFKQSGVKGAIQYLEEMGPQLGKTKTRINAAQMAIDTLRQRVGTVSDRAAPAVS